MHSCAPNKSQPECEQTCHENACEECTYKTACFIDESFFKAPPTQAFDSVDVFSCSAMWLMLTDISRRSQKNVALRPNVLLRHTLINSP